MIKRLIDITTQIKSALIKSSDDHNMKVNALIRKYLVQGLIKDGYINKKDFDKNVYRGFNDSK